MNVLDEVKEIKDYTIGHIHDQVNSGNKVSVLDAFTFIKEKCEENVYSPMAVKTVINDLVMQWYARYRNQKVFESDYLVSKMQSALVTKVAQDWFKDKYGEELFMNKREVDVFIHESRLFGNAIKMLKPKKKTSQEQVDVDINDNPVNVNAKTNIKVVPSDIHKIGSLGKCGCKIDDTDTEYTAFYCKVELANIEEILLRSILSLYGCEIVETNDVPRSSEPFDCDIEFKTNLPYERYMNL